MLSALRESVLLVLGTMLCHKDDTRVQANACSTLASLSLVRQNVALITQSGGMQLVLESLTSCAGDGGGGGGEPAQGWHEPGRARVVCKACYALATFAEASAARRALSPPSLAAWPACLLACLPAWFLACLPPGLPACLPCLPALPT